MSESSVAYRDFNNFQIGDDPYRLANGLIRELAADVGLNLSEEPNSQELGQLVAELGPNREHRLNPDRPEIGREYAVEYVTESGILLATTRSLRSPDYTDPSYHNKPPYSVVFGGMANWIDQSLVMVNQGPKRVAILAGNDRQMKTPTEITNPKVRAFKSHFGDFPTEKQYLEEFGPNAINQGRKDTDFHEVHLLDTKGSSAAQLARELYEEYPELLNMAVLAVKAAPAGIQLAAELREVGRAMSDSYDRNPNAPQVFYQQNGKPVAKTTKQEEVPTRWQKAHTALRSIAVSARKIYEAGAADGLLS